MSWTLASRKFYCFISLTRRHYQDALRFERRNGEAPDAVQSYFEACVQRWASDVLNLLNVDINMRNRHELPRVEAGKAKLLVGNHVSYLDGPLLLAACPTNFLIKHEISQWPFLGAPIRKSGAIFVKRQNNESRKIARQQLAAQIKESKRNICIFPAGTTSVFAEKPWRLGGFEVARDAKIPVQPFRLTYEPLRKVAYINRDVFPVHFYNLLRQKKIKAHIEFANARLIDSPLNDMYSIKSWTDEIHYKKATKLLPTSHHDLTRHCYDLY